MRRATLPFTLLCVLVTAIQARAQEQRSGSRQDPELFAREWLGAWNSHDVDRILTFYTGDAVYEDVPTVTNGWGVPQRGHEMIRDALIQMFEEMPDMAFEMVSASNVGGRLAVESIMTGTQTGDYPALPATGRSISIRLVSLIELSGGRIVSERDYYDAYLFLTQLGAVSPFRTEESRAADRQALMDADRTFAAAATAGEMDRVFYYWTDDATIYPAGMPAVRGKEAIRAFVAANRAQPGLSIRWKPREAVLSDDGSLGYTVGDYEVSVARGDGGTTTRHGRYLQAWRKDEAVAWRCTLEIQAPLSARGGPDVRPGGEGS